MSLNLLYTSRYINLNSRILEYFFYLGIGQVNEYDTIRYDTVCVFSFYHLLQIGARLNVISLNV